LPLALSAYPSAEASGNSRDAGRRREIAGYGAACIATAQAMQTLYVYSENR